MPNTASEPIERVQDIHLPDADDDRVTQVFSELNARGASRFSQEIVAALIESRQKSDLRPLQDAVEAWYRSLLFIRDQHFLESVAAQAALEKKGERRIFEDDEIRTRLGL